MGLYTDRGEWLSQPVPMTGASRGLGNAQLSDGRWRGKPGYEEALLLALVAVEVIETVDTAQRAQITATISAMGGVARTRFVMRRLRSRSAPSTKREGKLPATTARSCWCCHRYRRRDPLHDTVFKTVSCSGPVG